MTVEILRRVDSLPPGSPRLEALKAEIRALPPDWAGPIELLVLHAVQEHMASMKTEQRQTQLRHQDARIRDRRWLAGIGAVFAAVILVRSWWAPEPTPAQERTTVVVLALAAGCVGALLPGAIAVESRWTSLTVRAVGAIALTVLILAIYKFLL